MRGTGPARSHATPTRSSAGGPALNALSCCWLVSGGPLGRAVMLLVHVMSAAAAAAIASAYGLGALVGDPVYAARGERGKIWRPATRSGSWAVKEPLLPIVEAEAARDVEFQLAAAAAGIPLPLPR